jgi:type IV secretion system protein VirB9
MTKRCVALVVGLAFFYLLFAHASVAVVAAPIATDSRVRTFVYGENEVFRITAKYGYQSNIEFGPKEEVETISVGDGVAWKITPAGGRLFVKPLKENVTTNLTVVTTKRAYQFELSSEIKKEEDLVYVVRFYYPNQDFDSARQFPQNKETSFESGALIDASYNFNYSLTGPNDVAPMKVFDDGQFTFFKFAGNNAVIPTFYAVDRNGVETPLITRSDGEYIIVERVLPQMTLRRGEQVVCVFNDNLIVAPVAQNQQAQ